MERQKVDTGAPETRFESRGLGLVKTEIGTMCVPCVVDTEWCRVASVAVSGEQVVISCG